MEVAIDMLTLRYLLKLYASSPFASALILEKKMVVECKLPFKSSVLIFLI